MRLSTLQSFYRYCLVVTPVLPEVSDKLPFLTSAHPKPTYMLCVALLTAAERYWKEKRRREKQKAAFLFVARCNYVGWIRAQRGLGAG